MSRLIQHLAARLRCAPLLLALAGLPVLLIGFVGERMWGHLPWERLALSLLLALLAMVLAWPLRRFVRLPQIAAQAVIWLLALVLFTGGLPILATAVLAAAALAIGLRLVPGNVPARPAIALTTGLMVIAGLSGWTLGLRLHVPVFWWPLLMAIVVLDWRDILQSIREAATGIAIAAAQAPRWSGFAALLLGLASTACWLPTLQYDDLTYHLALPSQLLAQGRYLPDPSHQMWSLAPWAGDVLHGIVTVMLQAHARGPLNALWLLLSAASLWSIATGLDATVRERWASVALLASFPPVVWMVAGMQTELPATAVMLALLAVTITPDRRWWLPAAILFSGLAALKSIHAFAAFPILVYGVIRHRKHMPMSAWPIAAMVMLLVAGSSYLMAWWYTGNPVLPLFNNIFGSPYAPLHEYRDLRWYTGLNVNLFWQMIFDTPRHVEAFPGGLGFAPLALAGMWLLALVRGPGRGMAWMLTAAVWLPLLPLQYARYAYPGLCALSLVLVLHSERMLRRRGMAWVIGGVCALNLAFQANSGWLHHSSALKRTIRAGGDTGQIFPNYVPERVLLSELPDGDDGIVLATDPNRAFIAELGERGRTVLGHDMKLASLWLVAEADPSGKGWQRLIRESGARWLLVTTARSAALQNGMERSDARRVSVLREAELWQLPAPP